MQVRESHPENGLGPVIVLQHLSRTLTGPLERLARKELRTFLIVIVRHTGWLDFAVTRFPQAQVLPPGVVGR
jgi:hypothetical protein